MGASERRTLSILCAGNAEAETTLVAISSYEKNFEKETSTRGYAHMREKRGKGK